MSDPGGAPTANSQFPITTTPEFPEWGIVRCVGPVYGQLVQSIGPAAKFTARLKSGASGGEIVANGTGVVLGPRP